MRQRNDLGRDRVWSLVWRIAVPSMLAQFVSVLYSIVDRIYVGNIPQVGDLALAGVGVCGPVVTMVGAVAFWVGIGGAPLMNIRMGEGRPQLARQILSNCAIMLVGFSIVLTALVLALREPMLRLFGASGETYPYAEAYFTIYLCGTIFALTSIGLNQFIIGQGDAKAGMLSVMIGAAMNILLDPVLIFGFSMGVRGAALATVLSQVASTCFVLWYLRRRARVRLTFAGWSWSIQGKVLLLGVSPFLIIALDSVMIIALNALLQRYGGPERGDILVTCNTIVQSFMLVMTMPLGGISGGTQSILSYNYGACQLQRVRQAQRYIALLCAGFTALMFLIARVGGPLFVGLFTQDPLIGELAGKAIRISTLAAVPLGIQYAIVDGFTGMSLVRYSLPLSLWRKSVYFLAVFLLPALLGVDAIFYAEPVSDILGPAVSITVYCVVINRVLRRRAQAMGKEQQL